MKAKWSTLNDPNDIYFSSRVTVFINRASVSLLMLIEITASFQAEALLGMQICCDGVASSLTTITPLLKHNHNPTITTPFSNIMNIDPANYPYLDIDGPITVQLVKPSYLDEVYPLLIVGPTGAGKSTFIEALAQDPSLRISSNKLEGFTQTVNTYTLMNVKRYAQQIWLVDVPGFADTRISMTNIVSMLKEWMQETGAGDLGHILYFTPIHSVRLPGSHREVLRTFQALTGAKTAGSITIVTSMWDNLWGDSATQRAESNFNQLQDTVWKEFVDDGAQIVKFFNTQESALSVLNTAFRSRAGRYFSLELQLRGQHQLKSAPFANHLVNDLQSRIQNLQIELASTKRDLKGASEQGDKLLTSTLDPKLKETEILLAKFKKELYDNFGIVSPPLPEVPSAIDGPSNTDIPIVSSQPSEAVVIHLSPAAELETTLQPLLPTESPGSPSNQPRAIISAAADPIVPKRQLITRVISSVKFWGDAVADRPDA
ncbi:hypothetical protein BJ165DRAFT_1533465 [Panaeolus papilionaceus]|nr:hypothetical protein BJ165DRAFT_1533465 [Panaeolus papilionaceus]